MNSKRRRALLNRFGEFGFSLGQRLFAKRDVAVAERRGMLFGELAFRLLKSRRERTISNLALAFPEWSDQERHETARGVFRHFGLVAADFMRTPLRSNEEVLQNVEIEGLEHFNAALALDKGIICCTAHFGNWERFGQWMVATGYPISVVARDANQGGVQERVLKIREQAGLSVLSRGDSARPILTALNKHKGMIGILPDQNSEESFVPFFGKPCGTVLGPAVIHRRTGAPLLPSYCARVGVGKYKIILLEPIDLENKIQDPKETMALLNAALESVIRRYPDQWLWMHDRWKEARRRNLL